MKKLFIFIILLISVWRLTGQESFVVAGIVTQDGKGVENAKITVTKVTEGSEGTESVAGNTWFTSTSNSIGRFHFMLKPGKYEIVCDYISPVAVPHELFVTGPAEFEITDNSIEDLEFKVVNGIGYIEANKAILENIQDTVPAVNYKWGKIPLFSEEECKLKAWGFLNTLKDEEGKDVLSGSSLGIPLKVYDMNGNVVFYQFPITNLDTRIGYIGVHAVGVKPEESNFFNYPSISLKELNDRLLEYKDKNFLMDSKIPDLKSGIASKLNIDPAELMFKRFLSLGPDAFGFHAVFTRFPDENEFIVDMNDFSILTNDKTPDEIRDESEAAFTLKYILDLQENK